MREVTDFFLFLKNLKLSIEITFFVSSRTRKRETQSKKSLFFPLRIRRLKKKKHFSVGTHKTFVISAIRSETTPPPPDSGSGRLLIIIVASRE